MPIEPQQPSTAGPAEWFTGDVTIEPMVRASAPSRVNVNTVRFAPGARTAWHCHTVSQTLVITHGTGLHQPRGEAVDHLHPGDVVVTPADVWHWHGAAPDEAMSHLSITESPGDGRPDARWGQHVTDQEYHQH